MYIVIILKYIRKCYYIKINNIDIFNSTLKTKKKYIILSNTTIMIMKIEIFIDYVE